MPAQATEQASDHANTLKSMALLRHKVQYCIARLTGRDERRYLWI